MNKIELRARVEEIGLIPVIRTSYRTSGGRNISWRYPLIEVTMTVPAPSKSF
jgi:hypothetical protein